MTGRAHVVVYQERHEEANLPEWAEGDPTGKLRFRIVAANGEPVLVGTEAYDDESHLERGIQDALRAAFGSTMHGTAGTEPIEYMQVRAD